METLKTSLGMLGMLISVFWIVYILVYAIELGKMKVRHKLKVCDLCFNKIKKMDEVKDN